MNFGQSKFIPVFVFVMFYENYKYIPMIIFLTIQLTELFLTSVRLSLIKQKFYEFKKKNLW